MDELLLLPGVSLQLGGRTKGWATGLEVQQLQTVHVWVSHRVSVAGNRTEPFFLAATKQQGSWWITR